MCSIACLDSSIDIVDGCFRHGRHRHSKEISGVLRHISKADVPETSHVLLQRQGKDAEETSRQSHWIVPASCCRLTSSLTSRALLTMCSFTCKQDFHQQRTQHCKPEILLFVHQQSLTNLTYSSQVTRPAARLLQFSLLHSPALPLLLKLETD